MEKQTRPSGRMPFGKDELGAMALVLESRHGGLAAEVAEFFSTTHLYNQDRRRGEAWARVADIVRERQALEVSRSHAEIGGERAGGWTRRRGGLNWSGDWRRV